MASHYNRLPSQYATRPTPLVGPSRGDPFYDRDRRLSYPAQPETGYTEGEHSLPRRGDRSHYPAHPAQDYASSQRESRGEVWTQTSWPRQPSVYSAHSSPPPPSVSAQYPRYYHDSRPAVSPQWEESARWENTPDERNFEPSPTWRYARREPSHRRLNSLLNPSPPSPRTVEYHRREPVPVAVEPPPLVARDYARYPPDHHPYDDRRPTYYERPPIPEAPALIPNNTYRQPQVERTLPNQWESHTYRPEIIPATRISRSVLTRDYKRPQQEPVGQSPYLPNNGTPYWTGGQGSTSGQHSRQGSFQSSHSVGTADRERSATGASPIGRRNVYAESTPLTSPTKTSRNRWDGSSDEHEYSGDEPVSAMSLPAHTLKQTVNDITRARDAFKESGGRREAVPGMSSGYLAPGASNSVNQSVTSRPMPRSTERPQPVVRRAWDPSTDRFVPIMDSNVQEPRQVERRLTGSAGPANTFTRIGQANSSPYGRASNVQHSSPMVRNNEAYPAREDVTVPTSTATHASGSNRQGVMSVHDLVSPSPVKPQTSTALSQGPSTPLLLDNDFMQVETSTKRGPMEQQGFASEASSQPMARVQLPRPEETTFDRHVFAPSRSESIPGLIHQRSSSDEPSNVGYSQIATPEIYTPEPDGDGALAEVEVQIAETTISSPNPPILLQPGEKISADGTMRILAPRPKAAEKDIAEILRKAITIRRTYDMQSREQRVNPILMDNLAKSDGPEQQIRFPTENLVEEVVDRVLTQFEEEQQMNIRAALATKLAEERELLAEKQQRLRDEYLTLHRRWVAHCAQLDSLFKANDMQETLTQAGRTTRRSAATLGDAVRSDLEMEQIIASLGNEDLTDPNHLAVRNVATIPDMISVVKGKVDHLFDDTNNEVDDPESFYDPRSGYCDWTPEEEGIFYAKYAESPKQFGIIAEFLPHKTSRQCVLYYYIHKKRIIDFRNAINAGNGRRRKGVRRSKASALLADVAQADSKRPPGRGRRARGGFAGRGRGGPPPSSEDNGDGDSRAKRRRVAEAPRPSDHDDAQLVDTDNNREASILPPKKRRGRKPGPKPAIASESPGQSPAPGETRNAEGTETTSRRKPNSTTTYWSESDRDTFMRLLALYGKDFKRISAALPNKTHVQVGNYYKNHNRELGLEKIALAAANRLRSPSDQDRFVTVTRAEASQSRTPMEETPANQPVERQVADATSAVGVLTLEQNGRPGQSVLRASTNSRGVVKEPVIKVYNEHSFQPGGTNRPQGVIMTPNGQAAYTLDVVQQPAQPQEPSAGASATAPLNFAR